MLKVGRFLFQKLIIWFSINNSGEIIHSLCQKMTPLIENPFFGQKKI